MKLRIKGNTIRLRLTRPEVESLGVGEVARVEERTRFGDGAELVYRLVVDASAATPGATFVGGVVTVTLPSVVAKRWARENVVGLEHVEALRDGGELRILVEKDFACLDQSMTRGEDQQGAYPNPGVCRSLGNAED